MPCDIGPLQEEFCETVVSMFNDSDGEYKILGTNFADDLFEPDIVVIDTDEWVFNVLCYYSKDVSGDGIVELFPTTFGMRKWGRFLGEARLPRLRHRRHAVWS